MADNNIVTVQRDELSHTGTTNIIDKDDRLFYLEPVRRWARRLYRTTFHNDNGRADQHSTMKTDVEIVLVDLPPTPRDGAVPDGTPNEAFDAGDVNLGES